MLSRRVIAYYGLICASRPLPPLYGLCSGPPPYGLLWAGSERVPNLLCLSVPFVPSSVPRWTGRLLLLVASPPTLAFTLFAQVRHPCRHASVGSCVVSVTRLQSSLNAAARRDCLPFTDKDVYVRAFTSRVTSMRCRIYYAGKPAIPATGLSGKTGSRMGCKQSRQDRQGGIRPLPIRPLHRNPPFTGLPRQGPLFRGPVPEKA